MVQKRYQAPAFPDEGDTGSFCGAVRIYRAVSAGTDLSAGSEEQHQPVLPYADNGVSVYSVGLCVALLFREGTDTEGAPAVPVDAGMPGEHPGRG